MWLLSRLVVLLAAVAVAVLFAALLEPVVSSLERHRWPRLVGTWTVMSAGFALAGLVAWWLVPRVAEQLTGIGDELSSAIEQARTWLTTGPLALSEEQVDDLRSGVMDVFAGLGGAGGGAGDGGGLVARAVSGVRLLLEVVTGFLIAVVLTFFFVKDGPQISRWLADHVDEEHRGTITRMGAAAWATVSAYLRGVAILATFNAVASFIAYSVIGLPLVFGLALLEFVGSFVPLVGAFAAGLVAAVVALVTGGVTEALLVVATAIAIEQVEDHFFQPVVIGRSVHLHAVVVLVVVTAGGLLFGLVGAILAVPVTAAATAAAGALRAARGAA